MNSESFLKHYAISMMARLPLCTFTPFIRDIPLIAYYHLVSNDNPLHTSELYLHKDVKNFVIDLHFLSKYFTPSSIISLSGSTANNKNNRKNNFYLTFDDGFREMHDIVAPILLKNGIPATFFINSAFTDNRSMCYQHKASLITKHLQFHTVSKSTLSKLNQVLPQAKQSLPLSNRILSIGYKERARVDKIAELLEIDIDEYLKKFQPYLTSEQIRTLIKQGFTIGAHSIDHPLYADLTLDEQVRQTTESMRFVRETFNLDYGIFAFPHTDRGVSKEYFRRIASTDVVDISFGTSGIIEDNMPNHYQRFSLERPLLPAKNLISYQLARRLWRQIKRKHVIKRQD